MSPLSAQIDAWSLPAKAMFNAACGYIIRRYAFIGPVDDPSEALVSLAVDG
jgi:hypothetical protein